MPDFTFAELNADQGTQTADYLRNTANAAANAVCGLYQQYPAGVIPSFGDPTGLGSFTDGLLNRLCSPRGQVPPSPSSPFSGGQCECVNYNVTYSYTGFGIPPGGGVQPLAGPIQGIKVNTLSSGSKQYVVVYGADGCGGVREFGVINSSLPGDVKIDGVARIDGLPDNCGQLPPAYPPVQIPPSAFQPNITVGLPGGNVSIPVTIIPTVIRPSFEFRPEINVDVGGINVNFNLGGIDFTLDNSGGPSITLPPGDSRPVPPPSTPPKEPYPKPCDLTEVQRKLDEIKKCACTKKKVLRNATYGAAEGRTVSVPPETKYAVVSGVASSGVKIQIAEGNAPDVYYMGWATWGLSAPGGERVPLNFQSVGLEAPERATTFSYSLSYGSTANLTIYYLEDEE